MEDDGVCCVCVICVVVVVIACCMLEEGEGGEIILQFDNIILYLFRELSFLLGDLRDELLGACFFLYSSLDMHSTLHSSKFKAQREAIFRQI